MHLQKGLVYLYTKTFLPLLLHFWNYDLSPNGQMISLVGAQARPQIQLLSAEWYKVLKIFIVEYLQPNKFKEKPSFNPIYQVSCFFSLDDASCFHAFPGRGRLSLSAQGKKYVFGKKNTVFPDNTGKQERSCAGATLFGKTIFLEGLKKISYFHVFFKEDHLSFSV